MPLPALLKDLLDQPVVARIRRNHGLEHATIHMLSRRPGAGRIAGHSDANGFWLFGNLDEEQISRAVEEALSRLRAGERHLAIHPNCGTNLVTSGILAGMAGAIAMSGAGRSARGSLARLPFAAFFATLALILSRPLGTRIQQQITTTGDPADLEILSIERRPRGNIMAHRVSTRST